MIEDSTAKLLLAVAIVGAATAPAAAQPAATNATVIGLEEEPPQQSWLHGQRAWLVAAVIYLVGVLTPVTYRRGACLVGRVATADDGHGEPP